MYLAACGETLNIDFTLPFNEFVPATCHTRFSLKVSHDGLYNFFFCIPVFLSCYYIFLFPHSPYFLGVSSVSCLHESKLFLLSRQRTRTCACPCQSATRAAAPSSPWPKTIRTSNSHQICLRLGRAKVLHHPNQQSPAGETSPTQSECVNKEQRDSLL